MISIQDKRGAQKRKNIIGTLEKIEKRKLADVRLIIYN